MTIQEKYKLKRAIYYLSADGDDYEKGMDILYKLLNPTSKSFVEKLNTVKTVSVWDLLKKK